jgi:hypothetical protein
MWMVKRSSGRRWDCKVLVRILIGLAGLCLSTFAQMGMIDISPKKHLPSDIGGIRILDAKTLAFKPMNDIAFTDISALAYDERRGLFALSNKGYLFNLDLQIEQKKIRRLELKEARVLRTKKGKALKKKKRDAEGMALDAEGLVISFERKPKVSLYDFKGKKIKNYPLAQELQDIENYTRANKALESVAMHPRFGVITAPEVPLKGSDTDLHTLYSLHTKWRFKASGQITSIELLPDNNLLILERDYNVFRGHSIWLSKVDIMACKTDICSSKNLATLRRSEGWKLDNFEGLTRIKDDLYLMISDDNGSFMQECIVVLFEIKNDRM